MNIDSQTQQDEDPGFRPLPSTPAEIHDAAGVVRGLRLRGMTWKAISEETGFSRVDSMRLVHDLFTLTDAAREASGHSTSAMGWGGRLSA
ncbi:hypothetical protein [Arthrobacter sp. IK3]|uniref:hypothetical protein n=1 Tax=Arthrobacter sp. IK3 TaxID=3448169 RepID=UPI003EE3A233